LMVEARGRAGLRQSAKALDCGNSGSTMRLLSGVVAAAPFVTTFTGDESLRTRPMERVAVPLREMGASVRTSGGYPPVEVEGGALRGIRHVPSVPSAQVKGAVLLAGVFADGETTVLEHARTRDHTERALAQLGAPVLVDGTAVTVTAFQHDGLDGLVPGDVSGAAFLTVAAALTGGTLHVSGVGLNPTRTRFLDVMERMGVRVEQRVTSEELGEPMGDLVVEGIGRLRGTDVGTEELPLVIDEVPALAALAAHASGETRFRSGAELRTKESDRLSGLAEALRSLGGDAAVEGDDLVVGGGGLRGGRAESSGDHRMAMASCVGALAAGSPCEVAGIEWASVSFPRFLEVLRALGGTVEVLG
jgi:3-phosphoshikimate 1-carboxyvinyltransferase